jgi:hypothetical protein
MSTSPTKLPVPFPSLFDRLEPSDIRLEPFPHIVIENALDPDLCERLVSTRQSYQDLSGGGRNRSNERVGYHASAMLQPVHIDIAWKQFAQVHINPETTLRVAEAFSDHWPSHLPSIEWLRGARFGAFPRDHHGDADVLCDARLEVIGPSTGPPWSHRMGHVDTSNRLFSALFYLRAPDDQTEGGGLDLYRYTNGIPENLNLFELPNDRIEKVTTMPYAANTLVVFPNSPIAIHGAEPRGISDRDRAYVFITAEVGRDLF